jgi:hypothetical protein
VRKRPAESVGAVGGIGGIVYGIVAGDWPVVVIGAWGLLPALISAGGVRGVLRKVWSGR